MTAITLVTVSPLRQVFTVMIGVMIMTITSHLSIDIGPVPLTFQTLGVLTIAMALPPGRAFLSILTWMAWGVAGMPLFALFYSGAESISGPTGGYFLGMLMAAPLMSACQFRWAKFFNALVPTARFRLQEGNAPLNFPASMVVGIIGSVVILFCGWAYLAWYYCGCNAALESGVYPFLLPSVLKVVLSACIISGFKLSKIGA
jgi:biotin transport system substrate-specific component